MKKNKKLFSPILSRQKSNLYTKTSIKQQKEKDAADDLFIL
jgi:hypothetical protein